MVRDISYCLRSLKTAVYNFQGIIPISDVIHFSTHRVIDTILASFCFSAFSQVSYSHFPCKDFIPLPSGLKFVTFFTNLLILFISTIDFCCRRRIFCHRRQSLSFFDLLILITRRRKFCHRYHFSIAVSNFSFTH